MDSTAWNESVLASLVSENPALLVQRSDVNTLAGKKGLASFKDRTLVTWPTNAMWTEFMLELGINDDGSSNAEAQLQFSLASMKWDVGPNPPKGRSFLLCSCGTMDTRWKRYACKRFQRCMNLWYALSSILHIVH